MIVADANLLVDLWMATDGSDLAEKVLFKDPFWVFPQLCVSEFRSVAIKFYSRTLINHTTLLSLIALPEITNGFKILPVLGEEVVNLSVNSGCTAYDCEYVSLALKHKISLITLDKQVLKAFPKMAFSPTSFLTEDGY